MVRMIHDSDSENESEGDGQTPRGGPGGSSTLEDPRTLSQIKRSRIDLTKRYVFLCPTSLSKHFDVLPHQAKDSALLVFRCSRPWLFNTHTGGATRGDHIVSKVDTGARRRHTDAAPGLSSSGSSRASLAGALYRNDFSREFLQWVLTKEKEGCVFWYKPERDLFKLSAFFEEKIDPVNEIPYRPLLLDAHWWRVRFQRTTARYTGSPAMIMTAITELRERRRDQDDMELQSWVPSSRRQPQDIDMLALQELIYQSNPSLEPIAKWPYAPSMRFLPRSPKVPLADYPGQELKARGFIEDPLARAGMGDASPEHSRIGRWPEMARDRYDDCRSMWQKEESSFARRQCFAMHGFASLKSAPSGSMSAR